MIFIFLSFREKAHDNKNSVMKIQNLIVNHQAWPVKSNPSFCSLVFLVKQNLILTFLF